MSIEFVTDVEPVDLTDEGDRVQVIVGKDEIMLFQNDYCESGGICFSKVILTFDELMQIVSVLQKREKP